VKKNIKILIAEDSKVITALLYSIFSEDKYISIIGCARNGKEAIEFVRDLKPDLVTMDVHMPIMNGLNATSVIMDEFPLPIVIISSQVNNLELNTTFDALNMGALAVIEKPKDVCGNKFDEYKYNLLNTIHAMSQVKVIRRRINKNILPYNYRYSTCLEKVKNNVYEILALGSSTGGPEALMYILSRLRFDFPVPIVIVQHISEGFIEGFVAWLQKGCQLKISIAKNNTSLAAGHVYFAPDNQHLTIIRKDKPYIKLIKTKKVDYYRPSITELFSSLARSYPGVSVAGLLTGMGKDGADGLLAMKQVDSHTFIQNKSSSTVFGMAGQAMKLNASSEVLDLVDIPVFLAKLFQ
jgi:two-component system chemotaxis response regulator CheB